MRSWLIFVVLGLALVAVPSASAKGPFQVCGASACTILGPETQPPIRLFGLPDGTATIVPPPPAPYYVVKFADIAETLAYWVPSASALRIVPQQGSGSWVRALPAEESLLRAKTAGVRAYPPPRRVDAYVDYHHVRQPLGWLKLATVGKPVTLTAARRWLDVRFFGGHSPWTDGSSQLRISRSGNYLMRDGVTLTIPRSVADRVRRGLPLG